MFLEISNPPTGFSPTMICRNCELDITLSFVPSPRMIQYVTTILMRKEMYNLKKFVESNLKLQGDIINVSSFWFPSGPEAGFEFPV
jgi:hypothetical protein